MYIAQNNRLNCAEQRVRFWPPGEDLNFRYLGDTVQDLHIVEAYRAPGPSKMWGKGGLSFTKERRIAVSGLSKAVNQKESQTLGLSGEIKTNQAQRRRCKHKRKSPKAREESP